MPKPFLALRDGVDDARTTVRHGVHYLRHLAPGNRVRGDLGWVREGAPPVVLAHGFLGTRGTMQPLAQRLRGDGRAVFTYAFGTFNLASVRLSAQHLAEHLERICEDLDVPRVDLVGYSMGGLISLHAIKFLQAHHRVRRVVTLGTPFGGTWMGAVGVGVFGALSPSVWQVLPGSSFLQELGDAPLPPGIRMRQIHANSDAFCPAPGPQKGVSPRDYLILPGGHSSLVVTRRFYEATLEFLESPDGARLRVEPGDEPARAVPGSARLRLVAG